jgi:hypothetical protein
MTSLSPSLYSVTLCPGDALILAGMLQAQPMTHVSHSQFNCAWDGDLATVGNEVRSDFSDRIRNSVWVREAKCIIIYPDSDQTEFIECAIHNLASDPLPSTSTSVDLRAAFSRVRLP